MDVKDNALQELIDLKTMLLKSLYSVEQQNINFLANSYKINQKLIKEQKKYYTFMKYQKLINKKKKQIIAIMTICLLIIIFTILSSTFIKIELFNNLFLVANLTTSAVLIPVIYKKIYNYKICNDFIKKNRYKTIKK